MTSEKVKIPALALDGQNWKNFRAKLIEAAAMQEVLGFLAGWEVEPDDKDSEEWDDWYGYDAVAKFLIYPTLPLELLRPIRKLRTVHEMFEFLAHHFHDYDPIERDAQTNNAKPAQTIKSTMVKLVLCMCTPKMLTRHSNEPA